jgi:hypothetical protein
MILSRHPRWQRPGFCELALLSCHLEFSTTYELLLAFSPFLSPFFSMIYSRAIFNSFVFMFLQTGGAPLPRLRKSRPNAGV